MHTSFPLWIIIIMKCFALMIDLYWHGLQLLAAAHMLNKMRCTVFYYDRNTKLLENHTE